MKIGWKRTVAGLVAVIGVIVLSWLWLLRGPEFPPLGSNAYRLVAGDTLVRGEIQPFTATYQRTTKVFGFIPVSSDPATLSVRPAVTDTSSALDVSIVLDNSGTELEDRILLDRQTLTPLERQFELQNGGTASVTFDGNRITGSVTQGTTVRDVAFDYESPVFEVSLLELVFASIPLTEGFVARLAWDNMLSADAAWADMRVAGSEQIQAADGTVYDTQLVQVRFASGNRRWFWIAREPPYKIRVINFSRGRAVFSVWDLEKTEGG